MNIYKTKCALWLTFKRWNLAATKHDDTSFLVYQDMTGCIVAEVSFIHFYDELSPGLFQPLSKKKILPASAIYIFANFKEILCTAFGLSFPNSNCKL